MAVKLTVIVLVVFTLPAGELTTVSPTAGPITTTTIFLSTVVVPLIALGLLANVLPLALVDAIVNGTVSTITSTTPKISIVLTATPFRQAATVNAAIVTPGDDVATVGDFNTIVVAAKQAAVTDVV